MTTLFRFGFCVPVLNGRTIREDVPSSKLILYEDVIMSSRHP